MADGDRGEVLAELDQEVLEVAFSPDGRLLSACGGWGSVRMWDLASRREVAPADGSGAEPGGRGICPGMWADCVAFSPDSRVLAVGGNDAGAGEGPTCRAGVFLFDVASQKRIDLRPGGRRARPVADGCESVTWVAFSPDGALLAATDDSGTVCLWDATGRRLLAGFVSDDSMALCCAFSPDSTVLAASDSSGAVHLWNTSDSHRIHRIGLLQSRRERAVDCLAFHPDGRTLATACGNVVRLWDLAGLHTVGIPLTAHGGPVNAMVFHPGGRSLATASDDHSACLWNLASGQVSRPLLDHTERVCSVAFHPEGSFLATGSADRTVRLWATDSWRWR